jgi:hypothetical protein
MRLIIGHCFVPSATFSALPTTILQDHLAFLSSKVLPFYFTTLPLLSDFASRSARFSNHTHTLPASFSSLPYLSPYSVPYHTVTNFISLIYKFTYVSLIFFPSSHPLICFLIYQFLSIFSHSDPAQNIDFPLLCFRYRFQSLVTRTRRFRERSHSLPISLVSPSYHDTHAVAVT